MARESVMTPAEEHLAFYYMIGQAITQWSHVEISLADVVRACLGDIERDAISLAFYSVENFRSKLQMADNLVNSKFRGSDALDEWNKMLERIQRATKARNALAHHWLLVHPDAKPGRRCGLQPFVP